jgi:hypothetical protein
MNMNHKLNIAVLTLGIAALLGASHLLDGRSEAEMAEAVAADLQDAKAAAARQSGEVKRELTAIEVMAKYKDLGAKQ